MAASRFRRSPIDPLPPQAVQAAQPTPPSAPAHVLPRLPPPHSLCDPEKRGILAALAATGGNKTQAAAILETDRSTLYKKLKDYDIES